jgi:sigma-B regulation protein RsbU (phosphoserine phosphatase)
MLMSSVISSARMLYDSCSGPDEMAQRLNSVMHRSTDAGHFVTMFIGDLDLASGRLTYVNAGHNAPLLVDGSGVRELPAQGVPVAVLPDFPYASETVEIAPGTLFALYTDGIPEAQRGEEFFGDERLVAAIRELAPLAALEDVADGVVKRVEAYVGDSPRSDDVTLLLLRRAAS